MRRFRFETGEGDLAGIEFGDPVRDYALVWLHATGFNAMTYQSLLAPLGLRTRVAGLDLRGHGRTTLPADPKTLKSWKRYRDDVIAWLQGNAPQGVVLAGHSMGGTVALMVAGRRPDLVKGLVLADPVILRPRFYMMQHLVPGFRTLTASSSPLARRARKRRDTFPSADAAREAYGGRATFKTWREPFLDDYLLDALERVDTNPPDSPDQTWTLLCRPRWESATFGAQRNRPWGALSKVRRRKIPITVLRADQGSVLTDRVATRLLRRNPNIIMDRRRGTSHFLPMEAPYEVRDVLSAYLSRLVEGFSPEDEGAVKRTL